MIHDEKHPLLRRYPFTRLDHLRFGWLFLRWLPGLLLVRLQSASLSDDERSMEETAFVASLLVEFCRASRDHARSNETILKTRALFRLQVRRACTLGFPARRRVKVYRTILRKMTHLIDHQMVGV